MLLKHGVLIILVSELMVLLYCKELHAQAKRLVSHLDVAFSTILHVDEETSLNELFNNVAKTVTDNLLMC